MRSSAHATASKQISEERSLALANILRFCGLASDEDSSLVMDEDIDGLKRQMNTFPAEQC
jgi:hypothetical protein